MFLSPEKKIFCPYCLAEIHFRKEFINCGVCKSILPIEYIEKFDLAKPCFAQIIGWSNVGKTVFYQSLTLMLSSLGNAWQQKYYLSAQTEATQNFKRNTMRFLETGEMPPPTEEGQEITYIMLLFGMERWGNRTLVMRDVAGESFIPMSFPIEKVPYLMYVPTVLMMVSFYDMNQGGKTMEELLNGYLTTLREKQRTLPSDQKRNFARVQRSVVVVLSKADLIKKVLPDPLQNFLDNDPFAAVLNNLSDISPLDAIFMQDYMAKLYRVSEAIRLFVDQDTYGHAMIRMAQANNIQLKFAIISSTGQPVGPNNTLVGRARPMRVLDPLFWTLELQSR